MKKKNKSIQKKTKIESDKLRKIYFQPEKAGSFGGVDALKRHSKVNRRRAKQWLSFQDTYTLHKPVRTKFNRRRTIVGGIDHQWQSDLIDVKNLKKDNKGFVFLLTCIDVFSKFAWVLPLKNKSGVTVTEAFENVFKLGRKPLTLQTDKGKEFTNKTVQDFLKKKQNGFLLFRKRQHKSFDSRTLQSNVERKNVEILHKEQYE